jgi:Spy/CpxP family protein refolding chaperone
MAAMHCSGEMAAMMRSAHGVSGTNMQMMHGPAHGVSGLYSPAMLLKHKQDLGLSGEQVSRLEQLQKEAQPACMQHMQVGVTAFQAANQMLDAAVPDFAAYSAKLKEASAHMVEGQVALAKAAVGARNVLTAEQQQKLKQMMQKVHKK